MGHAETFIVEQRGMKNCWHSNSLRVEGSGPLRRHRHVTLSPSRLHDVNDSVHVTKIEVELEETPDGVVLLGSMPSELDTTAEINSTYPDGIPGPGAVVVRAEEALIVVLVLLLWVAAIALFFNRWGKIRMLEPYQPKFQQQHRQSCVIDPNPLQHRSYSKFNIQCADHLAVHQASCSSGGQSRLRQNSVIVGSSSSLLHSAQDMPRRTKSAFDIQSLVLAETVSLEEKEDFEPDTIKCLRPPSESTRLLLRDRRTSLLVEKAESMAKPLQRERGMSICQLGSPMLRDRCPSTCQFDRMDVLARTAQPVPRERGMSICYFDRTDVLARPLQKDRCGNSTCHFDRMDVLARATPHLNKTLSRERRVSICNFVEREDEQLPGRGALRDRRSSAESGERTETAKSKEIKSEKLEVFAKCTPREKSSQAYHYDRPSCSKTPDPVLGYKATCV